jgi:hypothetical protein
MALVGGDIGGGMLIQDSGTVKGAVNWGEKGKSPSGLVDNDVFRGMEDIDIRLPIEDLVDKAEVGELDEGNEVRTCCLGLGLAKGYM